MIPDEIMIKDLGRREISVLIDNKIVAIRIREENQFRIIK